MKSSRQLSHITDQLLGADDLILGVADQKIAGRLLLEFVEKMIDVLVGERRSASAERIAESRIHIGTGREKMWRLKASFA